MMTWRSPFFSGNAQVLGERMEWSMKGARAAFVKCLRREGPG